MPKKSKGRVKRQPRPFYRADRDRWYVEVGGKQINLGPDETEAFVKYHEIMAKRTPITPTVRVGVIVENFLEYVEKANAPKTYEIYRDSVNKFVTYLSHEFPGLRAWRSQV